MYGDGRSEQVIGRFLRAQAARRGAAGRCRCRSRDHRTYNRDGSAFDVGETFSGVDFQAGVRAAQEFTALVRDLDVTPAQANAAAGDAGPLPAEVLDGVAGIYDRYFREAVHGRW